MFQTKDKMCDISDTTYLNTFTTTIVAKTTSRSKGATAGRDAHSTSHPPTSVPTEGKVENRAGHGACHVWAQGFFSASDGCSVLGNMLDEVHLLELFFIGIDVFPLLQHAQDTFNS